MCIIMHIYTHNVSNNHVLHCGSFAFVPSMGEVDKCVSSELQSETCFKKIYI